MKRTPWVNGSAASLSALILAACSTSTIKVADRPDAGACPTGTTRCAGVCASLGSNPLHCGACGRKCASAEVCSVGQCAVACAPGLAPCGQACFSTDSDPANCGACGRSCGAGEKCSAGQCAGACGTGLTACGSACVDLTSDRRNCGACGRDCGLTTCALGSCAAVCQPACAGRQCGSDGCGGSCGACPTGTGCTTLATCAATSCAVSVMPQSGPPSTTFALSSSSNGTSCTWSVDATAQGTACNSSAPLVGSALGVGIHTATLEVLTGPSGPKQCSYSFTVTPPPVTSCVIAVSPTGGTTTTAFVAQAQSNGSSCTWLVDGVSNGAVGCNGSANFLGSELGVGTHTVALQVGAGPGGPAACTTTVNVTSAPITTCSISASPTSGTTATAFVAQAQSNGSSCTWLVDGVSRGAVGCNGSANFLGSSVAVGTHTVALQVGGGPGGPASCSTTITVTQVTTCTVTASPASGYPDTTFSVQAQSNGTSCTWSLDGAGKGATPCTASPLTAAVGEDLGVGTHTFTVVVVAGPGGPSQCSATVTVTTPTLTVIASGQASPWGIAVDGTSVYWTNAKASSTRNAWADFSGVQGTTAGWSYRESSGALMTYDAASARWQGSQQYLLLGPGWGHPGTPGNDAVLRWTASEAASVTIKGRAYDSQVGCGTDGVVVTIKKNATVLWQKTIALDDADPLGVSYSFDFPTTVAAGDAIDFSIGAGVDSGCDGTTFDPTIFLTSVVGGAVMKAPLAGGSPTVLAPNQDNPYWIALDGTDVFWSNAAWSIGCPGGAGSVMRVSKSGAGAPWAVASQQCHPLGIVLDGSSVYWANFDNGTVMKVAKGGGSTTVIAAAQPQPGGIAVFGPNVYWNNHNAVGAGALMVAPVTGTGNPTPLAPNLVRPAHLIGDGTSLYWTSLAAATGAVLTMPLGGGPVTTLSGSQDNPFGIAMDSTHVYWVNSGPAGSVMKVPKAGGRALRLASNQNDPHGIAVDQGWVYWANAGDGTVVRRPIR